MSLKVDVESGKLFIKKSKDGPEDKYFVHNKSKESQFEKPLFLQFCTIKFAPFFSVYCVLFSPAVGEIPENACKTCHCGGNREREGCAERVCV